MQGAMSSDTLYPMSNLIFQVASKCMICYFTDDCTYETFDAW